MKGLLPSLHALTQSALVCSTGTVEPGREVLIKDRISSLLSSIIEADDTDWQLVAQKISSIDDPTEEELHTIAHEINRNGLKYLVAWFYEKYPDKGTEVDLHRNATRMWWMSRYAHPRLGMLNFAREADGHVVVDLWHTTRGASGFRSFKDFVSGKPTFFFGSRGAVLDNIDSLQDYVDEAEDDSEDNNLYVKRGRFRVMPLLWFDDKNVAELRRNVSKSNVVAALIKSHPYFSQHNPEFDLNAEDDKKWKEMLYYRTERIGGYKLPLELRLDNNCVDDANLPLAAGFNATLVVDVSGLAGAILPPGSATPETESVVAWDVPGTLVEEWPWERLE
jgi:hypothetical protein